MARTSIEKRQAEDTRRFCESVMAESWTGINPDWLDSGDPAERAKVAEWLESPDRGDPRFAEHAKAEREAVKYLTNWHKRARLMDWWRGILRERIKATLTHWGVCTQRWDMASTGVRNLQPDGCGWLTDMKILLRIDDAATRAKMRSDKLVNKIKTPGRLFDRHGDIISSNKFTAYTPLGEPRRLQWNPDDGAMTATYYDEISAKTVRVDYLYVKVMAEAFPGCPLGVNQPHKPLGVRKDGELVGIVMPLSG